MVVLQFILAPYSAVVNFAMTVLSRKFEFQVTFIIDIVRFGGLISPSKCWHVFITPTVTTCLF